MRKFVYDAWNSIMDHNLNPLRHIPDLQVRHMVMQILAFMWSAIFALQSANVMLNFTISSIAHIVFVAGGVITVGTFKVAEKQPWRFGSYHSYGRGRGFTIYRDKQGNAHKVPLDEHDPGGEHE